MSSRGIFRKHLCTVLTLETCVGCCGCSWWREGDRQWCVYAFMFPYSVWCHVISRNILKHLCTVLILETWVGWGECSWWREGDRQWCVSAFMFPYCVVCYVISRNIRIHLGDRGGVLWVFIVSVRQAVVCVGVHVSLSSGVSCFLITWCVVTPRNTREHLGIELGGAGREVGGVGEAGGRRWSRRRGCIMYLEACVFGDLPTQIRQCVNRVSEEAAADPRRKEVISE